MTTGLQAVIAGWKASGGIYFGDSRDSDFLGSISRLKPSGQASGRPWFRGSVVPWSRVEQ